VPAYARQLKLGAFLGLFLKLVRQAWRYGGFGWGFGFLLVVREEMFYG